VLEDAKNNNHHHIRRKRFTAKLIRPTKYIIKTFHTNSWER